MTNCEWPGHNAAMQEAGFCSVCQQGNLDPEWAERHGMSESLSTSNEEGWRLTDEESAAEALGYKHEPRERSDEDDERPTPVRVVVLKLEVQFDPDQTEHPALWNWNQVCDMGPMEAIAVLEVEKETERTVCAACGNEHVGACLEGQG